MPENPLQTSCEHAAIRIQYWFGKENLLKPHQLLNKKYKYDLVKTPRIPSQVEHLPLHGFLAKRKKQAKPHRVTKGESLKPLRFALDQAQCSVNQKDLNYFYSQHPLTSDRVAQCRLKEHLFVSKKLKSISKQKPTGPKRHEVVTIKSSSEQNPSQNPYLQEWEKVREERLFQIGRITKYFTD